MTSKMASVSGQEGLGPVAVLVARDAHRWIEGLVAKRVVLKASSHGTAFANAVVDVVSSSAALAAPPKAPMPA
jgi:hypothetical protein